MKRKRIERIIFFFFCVCKEEERKEIEEKCSFKKSRKLLVLLADIEQTDRRYIFDKLYKRDVLN